MIRWGGYLGWLLANGYTSQTYCYDIIKWPKSDQLIFRQVFIFFRISLHRGDTCLCIKDMKIWILHNRWPLKVCNAPMIKHNDSMIHIAGYYSKVVTWFGLFYALFLEGYWLTPTMTRRYIKFDVKLRCTIQIIQPFFICFRKQSKHKKLLKTESSQNV